MTDQTTLKAAQERAYRALSVYQRAEKMHQYGMAALADIRACRAEYQQALDDLADLVHAADEEGTS